MTSMLGRSYFGEYTKHKGKRINRFQKLMKSFTIIRPWMRFTFFGLFAIGMVLPTPASTTHLHEKRAGGFSQDHSVLSVDGRPPFHQMAEFPSLVGEPDYEFITTNTHSGDLLTVAIVNEVLWNRVPVGQVDRQWLPPLDQTAKQ